MYIELVSDLVVFFSGGKCCDLFLAVLNDLRY